MLLEFTMYYPESRIATNCALRRNPMVLRVTANVEETQLATSFQDDINDRFVNLGVYIPIDVAPSYIQRIKDAMNAELTIALMHAYLDPVFGQPLAAPGNTISHFLSRQVAPQNPQAALRMYLQKRSPIGTKAKVSLRFSDKERQFANHVLGQFATLKQQSPQNVAAGIYQLFEDKEFQAINIKLNPEYKDVLEEITTAVTAILTGPVGLPDDTSEIGYLFLDRTRVRPAGFALGEHLYTLGLAPGEEIVLEQKSSRKETVAFEESLEREFLNKMEWETERSRTDESTESEQIATDTDTHIGGKASVQPKGGKLPVDGNLGVDAAGDFSTAVDLSEERTTTLTRTSSQRISNELRSTHKTSFKVSTEASFETLSRRVIRNPNETTPLTLHYFKVMQRLQLQQERFGVRLCWAPFVPKPGASLNYRIEELRKKLEDDAIAQLQLPPAPTPPKPDMQPEWIEGNPETVAFWGNVAFSAAFSYSELRLLKVSIPDDTVYTGRLRVKHQPVLPGIHVRLDADTINQGKNQEGEIEAEVLVYKSPGWTFYQAITIWLEAEVLRTLPSYTEDLEYQNLLEQHNAVIGAEISAARQKARQEAEPAVRQLITQADIRSELLARVIQYLGSIIEGEGDVEFWDRLIDFENIGYVLYPSYWSDDPVPFPEYGPTHILNASWARVYLPIRSVPAAPGKTNEEKFLHQLYRPLESVWMTQQEFNQLAFRVTNDLFGKQQEFAANGPKSVGDSWIETVPTDGTHVEAVLGATTAADDVTERRVEVAAAIEEARREAILIDNSLKSRVVDPISGQVTIGEEK
ncbi:MAG: hypothetical protein PVH17_09130 [Anaerolineae bacterium]|jgi:hypothetical protein